jgi:hypothetical protein
MGVEQSHCAQGTRRNSWTVGFIRRNRIVAGVGAGSCKIGRRPAHFAEGGEEALLVHQMVEGVEGRNDTGGGRGIDMGTQLD